MINGLVKFANRLDKLGLSKEADIIDSFVKKLIISGEITKLAQQSDELEEIDRRILELKSLESPLTPEQNQEMLDLEAKKIQLSQKKPEKLEGIGLEAPYSPESKIEEESSTRRFEQRYPKLTPGYESSSQWMQEAQSEEETVKKARLFLANMINDKLKNKVPLKEPEFRVLQDIVLNAKIKKQDGKSLYLRTDIYDPKFLEYLPHITGLLSEEHKNYFNSFAEFNKSFGYYNPIPVLVNAIIEGGYVKVTISSVVGGENQEQTKIIKPISLDEKKNAYFTGKEYRIFRTKPTFSGMPPQLDLSKVESQEVLKINISDILDISRFNLAEIIKEREEYWTSPADSDPRSKDRRSQMQKDVELSIPSTWEEVSGVSDRSRMLNNDILFSSASINDLIESGKIRVSSEAALNTETLLLLYKYLEALSNPRYQYPANIFEADGKKLEKLAPNIFRYNENGTLEFSSIEYQDRRSGVSLVFEERQKFLKSKGKEPQVKPNFSGPEQMTLLLKAIPAEEKRKIAEALSPADPSERKLINTFRKGYKDFTLVNLSEKLSESLYDTSDKSWRLFPGFRLFKDLDETKELKESIEILKALQKSGEALSEEQIQELEELRAREAASGPRIGYLTEGDVSSFGGMLNFSKLFLDSLAAENIIYKLDLKNRYVYLGSSRMLEGKDEKSRVSFEINPETGVAEEINSNLEEVKLGKEVETISEEQIEAMKKKLEEETLNIDVEEEKRKAEENLKAFKSMSDYARVSKTMNALEERSEIYEERYPQLQNQILEMQLETQRILTSIGKPIENQTSDKEKYFTRILSIEDRTKLFNTPVAEETALRKVLLLSEIFDGNREELFACAALTPSVCDDTLKSRVQQKTISELNVFLKRGKELSAQEGGEKKSIFDDHKGIREELRKNVVGMEDIFDIGLKSKLTDSQIIAGLASHYKTSIFGLSFGTAAGFKLSTAGIERFVNDEFADILNSSFRKFKLNYQSNDLERRGGEILEKFRSKTKQINNEEELRDRSNELLKTKISLKQKNEIKEKLKSLNDSIKELYTEREAIKAELDANNAMIEELKQKNPDESSSLVIFDGNSNKANYKDLFNKDFLKFLSNNNASDVRLPAALALLKASIHNLAANDPIRLGVKNTGLSKVNESILFFEAIKKTDSVDTRFEDVVIFDVSFAEDPRASYLKLKNKLEKANLLDKNYSYGFPKKFREMIGEGSEEFFRDPFSKTESISSQALSEFFKDLDQKYSDEQSISEEEMKSIIKKVLSNDKGIDESKIVFKPDSEENSVAKIVRSFNLIIELAKVKSDSEKVKSGEKKKEEARTKEDVAKSLNIVESEEVKKKKDFLLKNLLEEAKAQARSVHPISGRPVYQSYADPSFVTNIMFMAQDGVYSRVKATLSKENESNRFLGRKNFSNEEVLMGELTSAIANQEDARKTYLEVYGTEEIPSSITTVWDSLKREADGWEMWLQNISIGIKAGKLDKTPKLSPLVIKNVWNKSCSFISVIPIYAGYQEYVDNKNERQKLLKSKGTKYISHISGRVKTTKTLIKERVGTVKNPETGNLEPKIIEVEAETPVKVSLAPNFFSFQKWVKEVFELTGDSLFEIFSLDTEKVFNAIQMGIEVSENSVKGPLVDTLNKYLANDIVAINFANKIAALAIRGVIDLSSLPSQAEDKNQKEDIFEREEMRGREKVYTEESEGGFTEQSGDEELTDEDLVEGFKKRQTKGFEQSEEELNLKERKSRRAREREAQEREKIKARYDEELRKLRVGEVENFSEILDILDQRSAQAITMRQRGMRGISEEREKIQDRLSTFGDVQLKIFLNSLCSISLDLVRNPSKLLALVPELSSQIKIIEAEEEARKNLILIASLLKKELTKPDVNRSKIEEILKKSPTLERRVFGRMEYAKETSQSKPSRATGKSEKKRAAEERARMFFDALKNEIDELEEQKASSETTSETPQDQTVEPTPQPTPSAEPKKKGFGKKSSSIIFDRYSYINYVNSLLKR